MHSILSRQALNNTQETQRPFPSIPNLHSIDDLRRMCEIRPSHAIHTHTYPVITAVCLLTHPTTVIACTCGLLHRSARACRCVHACVCVLVLVCAVSCAVAVACACVRCTLSIMPVPVQHPLYCTLCTSPSVPHPVYRTLCTAAGAGGGGRLGRAAGRLAGRGGGREGRR